MFEVWTKFSGSGRPDRFLGEFDTYQEALEYANNHEDLHPSDWCGIGTTAKDEEGFLQWE